MFSVLLHKDNIYYYITKEKIDYFEKYIFCPLCYGNIYVYYLCTMAKGVKGSTPTNDNAPARTTYISTVGRLRKLKYMAFMEKTNATAIINESVDKAIAKYEKDNGPIPIK